MVAWLSWLERLVYIEKVGGSNPSATTVIVWYNRQVLLAEIAKVVTAGA